MRENGTQENPYIITTWSELEELSERYYDHENAYIAFDPDVENKVIDMAENPSAKTIRLYCWHIIGNGWTIRNLRSSVSIFEPRDALRISYVSDLNFEDFFLDGSAGTVYFTNDTAAFSGDWDRGNCKWTGCTFSGELVGNAYFTNNHWANSSSVREHPMLDRCALDIKCDDNSGFGRASGELFLRDTKLTINTQKSAHFKLKNSKLTGNYASLNVSGSTSVIDADVTELSGSGSLILVNSDRCSVPEGFTSVTTVQLSNEDHLKSIAFPVGVVEGINIELSASDFEQGTTSGDGGNSGSSTRVRTSEWHQFSGDPSKVTVAAESVSGKELLLNFMGYPQNSPPASCDLCWYESPYDFDISAYDVNYFRILLRYDSGNISPDEIQSCTIVSNDYESKWQIISGELTNTLFPVEKNFGAFMNAKNLEYAYIPRSCKKVGEWAFTNTKLRRVKIADDCGYYPTSFPPDCEIEFYGGGGEYGQLLDSEGYAVIDDDGARVYVKR